MCAACRFDFKNIEHVYPKPIRVSLMFHCTTLYLKVTMWRECSAGDFTLATNALAREYVRHEGEKIMT